MRFHSQATRPDVRRKGRLWLAAVALLALPSGCGSSASTEHADSQPRPSHPTAPVRALSVVAIGDSDATGVGDPSSRGWVGRYADLLKAETGAVVTVDNRAMEGDTSDQLRGDVAHDASLRRALADADVVLIGIGGADLNAGDVALSAGDCRGIGCYAAVLRRFDVNISAIAAGVRQVAPSALMRAMSLPNAFPGAGSAIPPFITANISRDEATTERDSVCRAMQANGGRCVDVVAAFNGPLARGDAYARGLMTKDPCCYPNAAGQQLIARLLIAQGLDGLPRAP